jgi:hypothetical protein
MSAWLTALIAEVNLVNAKSFEVTQIEPTVPWQNVIEM